MERYVTGGAIGVYEKGGAEEMEPGEAPAVSVLILIWGPSRGSLFPSPGVKSRCVHLMSHRNGDPGREARIRTSVRYLPGLEPINDEPIGVPLE
jgi:hypothetical protein